MTSIIAELIKDSHLLARGYYEEGEFIAEEIIADRISVQENLYREQPVAGEDAPRTPLREALQTKLRECFKANPPGEFVGERQIIEAVLEALRAATPEPCTPLTPEREAQARKVAAWPNHHFDTVLAFSDLFSEIDRLRAALRAATPQPRPFPFNRDEVAPDSLSVPLGTLRRCPKCKSADVIRGGHPDWEWECLACREKFNDAAHPQGED